MNITSQNFISVDKTTARNSYGEFFTIGDKVAHEDESVGSATILSFGADETKNEVRVNTDKGFAHIDFIHKT